MSKLSETEASLGTATVSENGNFPAHLLEKVQTRAFLAWEAAGKPAAGEEAYWNQALAELEAEIGPVGIPALAGMNPVAVKPPTSELKRVEAKPMPTAPAQAADLKPATPEIPPAPKSPEPKSPPIKMQPAAPALDVWKVKGKKALALFCFESAKSPLGLRVRKLASSLANRQNLVFLCTREAFDVPSSFVKSVVVGTISADELPAQVEEFCANAGAAFTSAFPNADQPVTLMGFEWSTAPALLQIRESRNVDAILALTSLEKQRSDMTSELSKHIEEIECRGIRQATKVLFHDPASADLARKIAPECQDRFVSAENPFPAADFDLKLDAGAIKARYNVGPIDPTILFVGDMHHRYGPDLLIKSMPALLRNHPQIRCIFVGDGEMLWPLKVYARYLCLDHAVRIVGDRRGQEMCELMAAADIVVVPSREATPWWPIQAAWAAGKPVVATHEAATALVSEEKDSILVYPSENSIVWGVERILYDLDLGKRLGQQGRFVLDKRFGPNIVAEHIEQLAGLKTK